MSDRYICQCLLEMYRDLSIVLTGIKFSDPYIVLRRSKIKKDWFHKWHETGILHIQAWTSALEDEMILYNMLHIIIHAYNNEKGIADVAQSTSRFHKKEYMRTARKLGATCAYEKSKGFYIDEISEEVREDCMRVIECYSTEIQLYLQTYKTYVESKSKKTRPSYCIYECPVCKKRVKAIENTNIICGVDLVPYERI